jgi:2-dehydro-3-deoxyphosphogluconate aldolase/(4S)-4-hydroxy-2-oxoglutarate aldolase
VRDVDAELLARLRASPVVAILRAGDAGRFLPACRVLVEAGVTCLEVTLTTPGALDALRAMRRGLPGDVLLGVGSVRTPGQASASVTAGAQFLVSPVFAPWMVRRTAGPEVPFVPGALTPTEVVRVWDSGAVPAVKLSPCGSVGGAAYVAQLHAPLPEIPLLPTGGVEIDDIPAYLSSGAAAVGLGGQLLGDALVDGGDLDALARRAGRAVAHAVA